MSAKPTALNQALIVSGIVAFILSLAAGLQFYSSLGDSFAGVVIYGTAGVLLTAIAVMLLPVCIALYHANHAFPALVFAVIWVILTGLAIFAEFGFFAKQQDAGESQRAATSEMSRQYQSAVDSAQAALDACPKNYVTKCINPAQKRLHEAQSAQTAAPISDSGEVMHPAYTWGERLTGISARSLQVYSTIIIVMMIELWASLSAYLLMQLYGVNHVVTELAKPAQAIQEAPMQAAAVSVPHLDTGARITGDGLAMLHAGEVVLNAKATTELDRLYPGLADSLNAGKLPVKRPLNVPLDVPLSVPLNDVKRVPTDLSGKRGKGRKGLIDTCLQCGKDYQVRAWTQVCCCSDCTAQLSGFADQAARQSAWAKSKHSAA